jgi:predicted N-acetyltransferase YhbS
MEFRSLHENELDDWAYHCASVFGGVGHAVDTAYFLRHYEDDPWRDVDGIFVAVDGGSIVSTVRVFRRKAWLMGSEIPMGGIGEVSTHAGYRGKGLAGTLLTMATEWMAEQGLNVSLLFAGAHDFYRRFGWECIPKPLRRFACTAELPCEGRATAGSDMRQLMVVEAASEKTNWMVVRTDPVYWQSWMTHALGKCVVATEGGGIVAWLAYDTDEGQWSVTEYRALPGYEQKFDGLCSLAATLEGRRGQPFTVPAWLPTGSPEQETYNAMYCMVKLITPFAAGGVEISSTQQLIRETRECRDSNLDHF